ncbi:hypothetical protein PVAP13_3KG486749 [Panicum virgatum]|uniref:S-acyltransferase n=1 Tax=Panicum virgatum TaxID=38727 RepID=A0A8T0US88_PANVG|nr:hypothetical protein PVAP13_3KG486749 [Panicum virgatum]
MAGRPGYLTLPIFSVLAAIGYVYYTAVFLAVPRWLGLSTAAGVANAAAFTALAATCLATYAVAVRRDPGRVPPGYVPDVEDAESTVHEIKRKSGDLRYCQKCCHYKPPRAHHCRVCKRCVLKMDHHCIWINNCVGHENYKIFLVFVLYAVVASFYAMILIIGSVMHSVPKDEQSGSDSSRTSIIICGVILSPLALALAVLLGWHIYLMLQNKTTIEELERCGWQKRVEISIIIHMTLVSMTILFQFWGLTYSAGSALYQILQEMAFGTVHHMIFQSLHHQCD